MDGSTGKVVTLPYGPVPKLSDGIRQNVGLLKDWNVEIHCCCCFIIALN